MVLLINSVLAYAIPDIPNNLKTQLLRERQLHRELEFQMDKELSKLAQGKGNQSAVLMDSDSATVIDEVGANDAAAAAAGGYFNRQQSVSALSQALRIRTAIRRKSIVPERED